MGWYPTALGIRPKSAEPAFYKGRARLIESRWQLRGMRREDCGFSVDAQGYGNGEMVWLTAPGQAFEVQASRNGLALSTSVIRADTSGKLEAPLVLAAQTPVQLRFACHD